MATIYLLMETFYNFVHKAFLEPALPPPFPAEVYRCFVFGFHDAFFCSDLAVLTKIPGLTGTRGNTAITAYVTSQLLHCSPASSQPLFCFGRVSSAEETRPNCWLDTASYAAYAHMWCLPCETCNHLRARCRSHPSTHRDANINL
jgi:hypothetical protein